MQEIINIELTEFLRDQFKHIPPTGPIPDLKKSLMEFMALAHKDLKIAHVEIQIAGPFVSIKMLYKDGGGLFGDGWKPEFILGD